jgi:hypothetical protein
MAVTFLRLSKTIPARVARGGPETKEADIFAGASFGPINRQEARGVPAFSRRFALNFLHLPAIFGACRSPPAGGL